MSTRVGSLLASARPAAEPVLARGVVTEPAAGGAWQLMLETVQGARTWQRSLSAGSCDELADAGALIIALVIDPNLRPEAPFDPQPVLPAAAPTATPAPTTPVPLVAAPRDDLASPLEPEQRTDGVTAHIAASALGDWGSLPRPALGVEIAFGVGVRPVALEVLGTVLPEAREVIAREPVRGGDVSLLAGGARACYVFEGVELTGLACGGLEVGRMRGSGVGATDWTDKRDPLWFAGRLGFSARYRLVGPAALRLGIEALLPFTRPEFVLENVGRVHQSAKVTARLALGLELLFR